MLWLIFHIGDQRCALRGSEVVEVLPLVDLERPLQGPSGFAGVFNYRGTVIPVVDLPMLLAQRDCPRRLSSRIILVKRTTAPEGGLVGLLAERVTELREVDAKGAAFQSGGLALGPVVSDAQGLIQLVDLARLLPNWLDAA